LIGLHRAGFAKAARLQYRILYFQIAIAVVACLAVYVSDSLPNELPKATSALEIDRRKRRCAFEPGILASYQQVEAHAEPPGLDGQNVLSTQHTVGNN
jgi:hypothetical protein